MSVRHNWAQLQVVGQSNRFWPWQLCLNLLTTISLRQSPEKRPGIWLQQRIVWLIDFSMMCNTWQHCSFVGKQLQLFQMLAGTPSKRLRKCIQPALNIEDFLKLFLKHKMWKKCLCHGTCQVVYMSLKYRLTKIIIKNLG